ncbi:ATP synthase F1 subunit delta [Flavobacteriales bacterium]|nr:ATP synthase F1 subunit delta [Flavobacteriales bacterium]
MQKTSASKRYAKALFELSLENNLTTEILTDLSFIFDLLKSNKNLEMLTSNPTIKKSSKKQIFVNTFAEKINKITLNFLLLVINKGREAYLADLINKYTEIYNNHNQISVIEVVSAKRLTDEQKNIITAKVSTGNNRKIYLKEQIDPDLIGGVIIKNDGVQYDASIRKKLKNARRAFKL